MKKAIFALSLVVVALAGFVLGRTTGSSPLATGSAPVNAAQFPLLPAPPKTNGYAVATQPEKDLIIEVPVEGASITGDFMDVSGRAKAGSQTAVRIIVRAADGTIAGSGEAAIDAQPGSFGRFSVSMPLSDHPPGKATVEVTLESGDSAPVSETRTFVFSEPNTVPARLYFSQKTASGEACNNVNPVSRLVASDMAVYRAVIEELLKGPSPAEKMAGNTTAIPSKTVLKSVAADAEGIVTADFNDALVKGITDPCQIAAIRAQITVTLRQFPEVRGVVISVNGKTDTILSP